MEKVKTVEVRDGKYFFDKQQFHIHNGNYRCVLYFGSTKCNAQIEKHIENDEEVYYYKKGFEHNHSFNNTLYIKACITEKLKERGKNIGRKQSVTLIAEEILREYGVDPHNNDIISLKRCVNILLESESSYLKEKMKKVNLSDYFVETDDKDLRIYADKSSLSFFSESDTLFCDGTFEKKKKDDKEFFQIYIIIAMKDSTRVPVFFVTMNGKSNNLYKKLYKAIDVCTNGGMKNKKLIMGDMEILNHQKIFDKYGKIEIKTCFFHYSQCILNKSTSIGNCSLKLVYGLKSLALAPLDKVQCLYSYLKRKYYLEYNGKNKDNNKELINYFETNCIGRIHNWNVSLFNNRTNNLCESLNRDLKRFFKRYKMYDLRKNLNELGKYICLYIEERKEMDKNRKDRKDTKYILKDKIIVDLMKIKNEVTEEVMLDLLFIINTSTYRNCLKEYLWKACSTLNSIGEDGKYLFFKLEDYIQLLRSKKEIKEDKYQNEEEYKSEEDIYQPEEDCSEEDTTKEILELEDKEIQSLEEKGTKKKKQKRQYKKEKKDKEKKMKESSDPKKKEEDSDVIEIDLTEEKKPKKPKKRGRKLSKKKEIVDKEKKMEEVMKERSDTRKKEEDTDTIVINLTEEKKPKEPKKTGRKLSKKKEMETEESDLEIVFQLK